MRVYLLFYDTTDNCTYAHSELISLHMTLEGAQKARDKLDPDCYPVDKYDKLTIRTQKVGP
jgi:hypothetical protein